MRRLVIVVALFVVSVAALAAQKQTLTDQDRADAVRIGVKAKGRLTGLGLTDAGVVFGNLLVPANGHKGFSVRISTPETWVQQLAANGAKEYRPFSVADITEDMLLPVLRVIVHPDTPFRISASGMVNTSSV